MKRISVLLAEDSALFREALCAVLADEDDIEVVGESTVRTASRNWKLETRNVGHQNPASSDEFLVSPRILLGIPGSVAYRLVVTCAAPEDWSDG